MNCLRLNCSWHCSRRSPYLSRRCATRSRPALSRKCSDHLKSPPLRVGDGEDDGAQATRARPASGSARRRVQRRAAGHDVVDDDDVLAAEFLRGAAQARRRRGRFRRACRGSAGASASRCCACGGRRGRPGCRLPLAEPAGDDVRLVVAARDVPAEVQRDGDEHVGLGAAALCALGARAADRRGTPPSGQRRWYFIWWMRCLSGSSKTPRRRMRSKCGTPLPMQCGHGAPCGASGIAHSSHAAARSSSFRASRRSRRRGSRRRRRRSRRSWRRRRGSRSRGRRAEQSSQRHDAGVYHMRIAHSFGCSQSVRIEAFPATRSIRTLHAVLERRTTTHAPPLPFSSKARRTKEQPINCLIAEAMANPELVNFAAGLVDSHTLPTRAGRARSRRRSSPTPSAAGRRCSTTRRWASPSCAAARCGTSSSSKASPPRDMGLTPADFVVTTGSQQALYLIGDVLIDPGDIVIAANPSYFVYTGTLAVARREGDDRADGRGRHGRRGRRSAARADRARGQARSREVHLLHELLPEPDRPDAVARAPAAAAGDREEVSARRTAS